MKDNGDGQMNERTFVNVELPLQLKIHDPTPQKNITDCDFLPLVFFSRNSDLRTSIVRLCVHT